MPFRRLRHTLKETRESLSRPVTKADLLPNRSELIALSAVLLLGVAELVLDSFSYRVIATALLATVCLVIMLSLWHRYLAKNG
jgi:hypothetical protein